jgi:hypothetical protein
MRSTTSFIAPPSARRWQCTISDFSRQSSEMGSGQIFPLFRGPCVSPGRPLVRVLLGAQKVWADPGRHAARQRLLALALPVVVWTGLSAGPKPRAPISTQIISALTPLAGPAARWKPWWWRTAALGRPLEERPDLLAQTDLAPVDRRLEGHERPGLRLSAHSAARLSGLGPTNAKSTGRPSNR